MSRMPHRITVETVTNTKSSSGSIGESWEPERDAWAEIMPIAGSEYQLVGRALPEATHVVRMNYHPAYPVTTAKRFLYGTQVLRVQYVENVKELGRWLMVYCKSVPA